MATMPQTRPPVKPAPPGTCNLLLMISSVAYTLRILQPDPRSGVRRAYRLRKADGTIYDVAQTEHGNECSCPDWVFRRDGLDPLGCKHCRSLQALGLLPRPAMAAPLELTEDDFIDPPAAPAPRVSRREAEWA